MLPADRMIHLPGGDNLRLQIKTCCRPRNGFFHFSLTKGYHRSPTGVKRYEDTDFDLVALVGLSENTVKFTSDRRQSQKISLDEIYALRADPCESLERAISELGLLNERVDISAPAGGV